MTEQQPPQSKPDFGERVELALSVFIHAFIRLLIFLIVGAAIGLAIYYGFPYLYRQFILPVQTNTTRLQEVEAQQNANNQAINQRLDQLQARLATMEQQNTQDKETITDLQSRLSSAESSITGQTATLKRLDQLQTQIDQLNKQLVQNQADTAALGKALQANDSPMAGLQWEVITLKGMELLNRSRLYLIENNLGLASADIQAARQILGDPQAPVPPDQKAGLKSLLSRLDLVLSSLPASPVTAADDLEIAWRQMAAGLANTPDAAFSSPLGIEVTPTVGATPSLQASLSPTPALTGAAALTGTPAATGTPAQTSRTATPTSAATATPTP